MEAISAVLSFTPRPAVFELGTLVNDEREKTEGLKVLQLPGPTPLPYSDQYYGCFALEWAARLPPLPPPPLCLLVVEVKK